MISTSIATVGFGKPAHICRKSTSRWDLLTITEELDRKEQLAEIGGPAYLTALINQTPNSLNAESIYGHIVSEHAARRRMIQAANQIAALAFNEQSEIEAVTSEAIQALESAVVRSTGDTLQPLSKSLTDVYELVEYQSSQTTELPGVPSGIHDWMYCSEIFKKAKSVFWQRDRDKARPVWNCPS